MVITQSKKVVKLDCFIDNRESIYSDISRFVTNLSAQVMAEDWSINFGVESNLWCSLKDVIWASNTTYDVLTCASISKQISITIDLNLSVNYGGFIRFFSIYPADNISEARTVADLAASYFNLVYGFIHDGKMFDVSFDAIGGIKDGLRDIYYYNYFGEKLIKIIDHKGLKYFDEIGITLKEENKYVIIDFSTCTSIKEFGGRDRSKYAHALNLDIFTPGSRGVTGIEAVHVGHPSGNIGCLGVIKMMFFKGRRRSIAKKTL